MSNAPASQTRPDGQSSEAGDKVVCYCRGVTVADVARHFSEPARTVDSFIGETGAGTRCSACLLDLELVLSEVLKKNSRAETALAVEHRDWRKQSGIVLAKDYRESGFLVNEGGLRTEVAVANHGLLFRDADSVVPFEYGVRLFAEGGSLAARAAGRLAAGGQLRLDLGALPGCPPRGWFLLSLKPLRRGLEGSIRPQFLISGRGFCATVHTQPHIMACRRKSVLVNGAGGRFSASVSLINAHLRDTRVRLLLSPVPGGDEVIEVAELTLAGFGSRMVPVDEIFTHRPRHGPFMLTVESDHPIRKHIINQLVDGAWSIDHFPNAK